MERSDHLPLLSRCVYLDSPSMGFTGGGVRKRGKVDSSQAAIVKALRKAGVSVYSLANMGGGCPDILCGWKGENVLMEIKNSDDPPSKRRLTKAEFTWHEFWCGQVDVVGSVEEAFKVLEID